MSETRTIDQIFSLEAKGVYLVKALVEFYKSSAPHVQQDLEPGLFSVVSVIRNRLEDPYIRRSLETLLADEGMAPVMASRELAGELEMAAGESRPQPKSKL
jgi:hypothetical protein